LAEHILAQDGAFLNYRQLWRSFRKPVSTHALVALHGAKYALHEFGRIALLWPAMRVPALEHS